MSPPATMFCTLLPRLSGPRVQVALAEAEQELLEQRVEKLLHSNHALQQDLKALVQEEEAVRKSGQALECAAATAKATLFHYFSQKSFSSKGR